MRRGYAILLDSIVALTFTLVILTSLLGMRTTAVTSSEMTMRKLHYASEDILDVLNKRGILDQVGEEWAAANGNRSDAHFLNATNTSIEYIEALLPPNVGYSLTIDDEVVANSSSPPVETSTALTHSTRLLVGYGRGLPTRGYVARAFLTNIRDKETSAYTFFGGFVGQGNITAYVRGIPSDAMIRRACLELNTPAAFTLRINDQDAGSFTPSGGNMSANLHEPGDGCVQSTYLAKILPGQDNKFEIQFTDGDISKQYIGGGFVHVVYNTSEMDTEEVSKTGRYYFPGINGIINIYDSFYVPGILSSMNANLHLKSNYSLFLNIGDKTVYNLTGNSSEQNIQIPDGAIRGAGLYYEPAADPKALSMNTIPVRLGSGNMSSTISSGNADVVLITDASGSMLRCLNNNNGCSHDSECPGSKCRFTYAKTLDKRFIEMVLNSSGNRVGLVTYNYAATKNSDLSSNEAALNGTVDAFASPGGGTCICCAIRMARTMLQQQSSDVRMKYIMVMTDGIANLRCSPPDENRTSCCTEDQSECPNPKCNNGLYYSSACNDYLDDTAMQNSIDDSAKAHTLANATVNAIGFGAASIGCTPALNGLKNISKYGNGTYCASDDATALQNCYVTFAQDIYTSSLRSQSVFFGGSLQQSILYPDSYLEFNFEPQSQLDYGEISLTRSTDRFADTVNCRGWIWVPPGVIVSDAKVTSYSGPHWTDRVTAGASGADVFRLSDWGSDYTLHGDPYTVNIPADEILIGVNNTVTVRTGDNESSTTGCSPDNRAIYTMRMQTLVGYGDVFSQISGCIWDIDFQDGSTYTAHIPSTYAGSNMCAYRAGGISYPQGDAMNDAVYRLLAHMDLDKDGRVDLLFDPTTIKFETSQAGGVQSLWGPARFKLIVWM